MIVISSTILLSIVFISISIIFLFPLNKYLPFDRRVTVVLGSAICYIIKSQGNKINLLKYVDFPVLMILTSIMIINHILMKQNLTIIMTSYLQKQIQMNRRYGFWLVSIISFVLAPIVTNDGLCLMLTSVVLDSFSTIDNKVIFEVQDNESDVHNEENNKSTKFQSNDYNDCLFFSLIICTSANIGSSMLYTGNPQNIIISNQSMVLISSLDFLLIQFLPSLINWLITTTFLDYCRTCNLDSFFHIRYYSNETFDIIQTHTQISQDEEENEVEVKEDQQMQNSLQLIPWIFLGFLIVFELSNLISLAVLFSLTAIALIITTILLEYYTSIEELSTRLCLIEKNIEEIFNSIDYNLLIIFTGLFIISGSYVDTSLPENFFRYISGDNDMPFTSFQSTILVSVYIIIVSQFVGNVPLVIMMINPILKINDVHIKKIAWFYLSYISTVSGNLTLSGSAANVIVCEIASRHKHHIKIDAVFHFKLLGCITIINIIIGCLIIALELYIVA